MANLIITIISIALVAVAAIMGAYYGGAAFQEGSIKADVNALISQAEQLAAAWRMRALNNGGNWDLPVVYAGINTLYLTTEYISQRPVPPPRISTDVWSATKINDISIVTGDTLDGVRVQLTANKVAGCNMIAKIIGGASGTPIAGTGTDATLSGNQIFNCVWFDDDASTALSESDSVYFIYRVR